MSFTIRLRSLVWFLTGLAVALVLVALFGAWRADASDHAESSFVPVTPCRLFDLRPEFQVGERSGPLGPDESYPVQVTGDNGNCAGIPVHATGVGLNVTVVEPTAASWLGVVPGDVTGTPGVSSLNWLPGSPPTPNKVDVGLDNNGRIRVFNRFGQVYVLADVVGYYTDRTLADLDTRLNRLEADLAALKDANDDLENLTTAMSITTDPHGYPVVRFSGVNLQVVDGSGDTDGPVNGTGNLIVGYHEDDGDIRTGSHNLIVGDSHTYTSYGGFVAGYDNSITDWYASVSGGSDNVASEGWASVSGGTWNTASGQWSSVCGGGHNTASGTDSSVSGGIWNEASYWYTSVSGGAHNVGSGEAATVSGGYYNQASGDFDSVAGGDNVACDKGKNGVCGEGTIGPTD